MGSDERKLCIGGYGNIPESDRMCQIYYVIYIIIMYAIRRIMPQIQFPAFEVDESGPQTVTVLEFGANLFEGLYARIAESIYGTMATTQIALVEDEDD